MAAKGKAAVRQPKLPSTSAASVSTSVSANASGPSASSASTAQSSVPATNTDSTASSSTATTVPSAATAAQEAQTTSSRLEGWPTSRRLRLKEPPWKWTAKQEQLLNVKHETIDSWKDLFDHKLTDEEEGAIQGVIDLFQQGKDSKSDHGNVLLFWRNLKRLTCELKEIEATVESHQNAFSPFVKEHGYEGYYGDFDVGNDTASLPLKTHKRPLPEDSEPSEPIKRSKTKASKASEEPAFSKLTLSKHNVLAPEIVQSELNMLDHRFLHADTFYRLEWLVNTIKVNFMSVLTLATETVSGVATSVLASKIKVPNLIYEYTTYNNNRYVFHEPDEPAGGAEMFSTFEKHSEGLDSGWRARLRRLVLGEMIAMSVQRRAFVGDGTLLIKKHHPEYDAFSTVMEQIFCLVFHQNKVHLVSSSFDDKYLRRLTYGDVRSVDTVKVKWSRGFALDDDADRAEACRMIMTMIFSLQALWKEKKHFWRPYRLLYRTRYA